MATVKEIYRKIDEKAPFSTQLGFDNAGFLVGRGDAEITKILVALDATSSVIKEAVAQDAGLIVSHHPIIWDKLSAVTDESITGNKLLTLMENKIAVISAHTNADAVEGGINTKLAELFGLSDVTILEEDGEINGVPYGIGRVGFVPQQSFGDFCKLTKKVLALEGLRCLDAGKEVHKVAVGGGACGSMLKDVLAHDCDTFVTSDVKHDVYLDAKELGLNLIDAGHHSTEVNFCGIMENWLKEAFPEIEVIVAKQQEVFSYC